MELVQPVLVKLRLEILKDKRKFFIEKETTTLVKSPPWIARRRDNSRRTSREDASMLRWSGAADTASGARRAAAEK